MNGGSWHLGKRRTDWPQKQPQNSLNLCLNFYSFSIWLSLQWDKIQRNFATLSNFKSLGNFLISQYLVNFCTYFGILFLLGKLSLLQIAKDWKIIQQSGNTVSLLPIFFKMDHSRPLLFIFRLFLKTDDSKKMFYKSCRGPDSNLSPLLEEADGLSTAPCIMLNVIS